MATRSVTEFDVEVNGIAKQEVKVHRADDADRVEWIARAYADHGYRLLETERDGEALLLFFGRMDQRRMPESVRDRIINVIQESGSVTGSEEDRLITSLIRNVVADEEGGEIRV